MHVYNMWIGLGLCVVFCSYLWSVDGAESDGRYSICSKIYKIKVNRGSRLV